MSGSKSYEVYVYRSGNWNIDSVYDDRQMAIYEAQKILERRGKTAVGAVRVIEEALDPNTGESHSKVVFRALKKPGDEPKTTDRAASLAKQTAARRSKEAESSDSQAERGERPSGCRGQAGTIHGDAGAERRRHRPRADRRHGPAGPLFPPVTFLAGC